MTVSTVPKGRPALGGKEKLPAPGAHPLNAPFGGSVGKERQRASDAYRALINHAEAGPGLAVAGIRGTHARVHEHVVHKGAVVEDGSALHDLAKVDQVLRIAE